MPQDREPNPPELKRGYAKCSWCPEIRKESMLHEHITEKNGTEMLCDHCLRKAVADSMDDINFEKDPNP